MLQQQAHWGSRTLTLEIEDIWPHVSAVIGYLVLLFCSVLGHQHLALVVVCWGGMRELACSHGCCSSEHTGAAEHSRWR
jgi:hypothetical protein